MAELADGYNSAIVLEKLRRGRGSAKKARSFNKRLTPWFYGRMRSATEYGALERGLEATHVNPRKTSSRCPRCGAELVETGYRTLGCPRCGYTGDRDVIARKPVHKSQSTQDVRVPGCPERPRAR